MEKQAELATDELLKLCETPKPPNVLLQKSGGLDQDVFVLLTSMLMSPSPQMEREFNLKLKDEHLYIVRNILGKGGTSIVYGAFQGDTKYAIKVTKIYNDPDRYTSYTREVNLLRKLKDEPRVINLIQTKVLDHFAFIVLEYAVSDLNQYLLTCTKQIPLFTICQFFHDMIKAVEAIHRIGVIHADLKPSNFLVMPDTRLKLTDFGISKIKQRLSDVANNQEPPEAVLAGTMNFLCPEVVGSIIHHKTLNINEAVDIWSLGVIFYYLLYKQLPFGHISDKREKMIAIASPNTILTWPPISKFYPKVLQELCMSCLQYQSSRRPKAPELLSLYPMEMIVPVD